MPLGRERTNRGGKPLVSVGINDGKGARLGVVAPADAVALEVRSKRLIKHCVPNQ
jgi:hypothetical protein